MTPHTSDAYDHAAAIGELDLPEAGQLDIERSVLPPQPDAEPPGDYVAEGAEAARATYRQITRDLADLRAEKERIQERINDLVEAEQLWAPIVHRLDNGIPRRKRDDET